MCSPKKAPRSAASRHSAPAIARAVPPIAAWRLRLYANIYVYEFAWGAHLAQHLSRRELKKDEVRDTLAQGADAVLSHKQLTLYILLAAVVVALGVFGWQTYTERQTVKATAAYDDAMKIFQARIRTASEPAQPGETTYIDEKNKYSDAAQKFAAVNAKYGHTRPGQLAAYYAALSDEKLNKSDEAKKWLQGLSESGLEDFAAMARFELAQLNDRMGQGDEAIKLYQQLIAKPVVLVPKPVAMMALAEHYGAKNPAEATKLYTQIKSDYPDTPIAEQATQEMNLLPGKS
jgi:predicted negative regulator of RcsB-dependent stress response